ncbi:unnamed protein product [Parnassius apollo]|uniref:(apollo) hypothetical protein n=1 Tax=Parnassius apollo TaxID=110799 RepID=A0A8S3XPG5_PARAO|nr:unnamed protein product [Parnassius apollo]
MALKFDIEKFKLKRFSVSVLFNSKAKSSMCWKYFGDLVLQDADENVNKKKKVLEDLVFCNFELKTFTLKTELMEGVKSGEKIQKAINETKKEFAITDKKLCSVTDVGTTVKRAVKLAKIDSHLCLGHDLEKDADNEQKKFLNLLETAAQTVEDDENDPICGNENEVEEDRSLFGNLSNVPSVKTSTPTHDETLIMLALKNNMLANLNKRFPTTEPLVTAALLDCRFMRLKEIVTYLKTKGMTPASFLVDRATEIKSITRDQSEDPQEVIQSPSTSKESLLTQLSRKYNYSQLNSESVEYIDQEVWKYIATADHAGLEDGDLLGHWKKRRNT